MRRHVGILCRHSGLAREHVCIARKNRLIVRKNLRQRQHRLILREHPVGGVVEVADRGGERTHGRKRQPALGSHAVEKRLLIESAHDEHPLDGLAAPTKAQSPVRRFTYRHDLEVKVRRGPSVDAQLVETGLVALLERGEIEKRVLHRPLHLVREPPRQEHVRGVRFDTLDGCGGWVVRLGPTH